MTPWEIVANLHDPESVLAELRPDDPFWIPASFAIDPFVGIIVRLPLRRDPNQYGSGLDPRVFERVVKLILDGQLTGDRLAEAIEALSRSCREPEWLFWYKPILQGEMDIPVPLATFNKYCPLEAQIPPPVLNKPKALTTSAKLPNRFVIQPIYPSDYVFWMIDSRHQPIEIRGYDSRIQRIRDNRMMDILADFAREKPVDIVLMGYQNSSGFIVDDILSREQFTQESGIISLEKRLAALDHLGIPVVQTSPPLIPQMEDEFFKELGLIFEQGYKEAVIRNLDANYPFRVQCDINISPTMKGIVTCTEVIFGKGIRGESKRGDKTIKAFIRLGLKASIWETISDSLIGRRLDILSCGQKDGEFLLPIFQNWRS
jgi:hypothetical protein